MENAMIKEKQNKKSTTLLIFICWALYACSYIGKLNYAANITRVMSHYGVSHADAGMVSTLFFFSYGIGQIVHGLFCKKYNLKWMVFISTALSAICNVTIALTDSFDLIKILWLCNGIALSALWPSLIRLLSETVSYRDMARASVVMGTTTATGTFIIYGLSATFATFTDFRLIFGVAAAALAASALLWIFSIDGICKSVREENETLEPTLKKEADPAASAGKGVIYLMICVLAIAGVATNFIKDGLTTWVPSILKERYAIDDSLSIILTLALPVVTIFGNAFSVAMHKRIPDFIYQCTLIFAISAAIILAILGAFETASLVLPLICFAAVCFFVGSNNSLITSNFPLFMKGKVNSGLIAGILNGFCYAGSTLSSYTLGLIADNYGWNTAFNVLLCVSLATAALVVIYVPIKVIIAKRECKNATPESDKADTAI
jgi:OPA family glycerol-3-phosphate transporter-like MFS transporter